MPNDTSATERSPAAGFVVTTRRSRGRPRKDARPPDAPSTKDLILSAAAEAFASRGFDGASLNEIAASVGLSTGAVYSHFRGKPELLLAVVETTLDSVDPRRHAADDLTPQYLHDWIDWIMAPERPALRALIAEIHHAAMRHPDMRDLLTAYGNRFGRTITALVRKWQEDGLLSADRDPRAVTQMFLTETLGMCSNAAFNPGLLRDRTFRELFDRQLRALLGETRPASRRSRASKVAPAART